MFSCYPRDIVQLVVLILYEKNGFISTDVFSTHSDGRQIGESAMIVIDTETRNYEKIPVM